MRGLPAIVAFAALVVLAVAVLLPIGLTALNGFKELGELQTHPFGASARLDVEQLLGASWRACATGRCSAIRC